MAARKLETGPTAETVRTNIARIRDEQRVTLRQLSARMSELGRPMSNSSISQIETGTRRVDVDDLVTIAVALDVSPLALLMPHAGVDPRATVQASGLENISAHDYLAFLEGYRSPTRPSGIVFALRSMPSITRSPQWGLFREYDELKLERRVRTDGGHVQSETTIGTAEGLGPFGSDDGDD